MANKTYTLKDKPVSAKQGKNLGPTNSKPQKIEMKRVEPGFKAETKIVKPGGK